ncbi:tetratricopeptide repeat protein [Nostoc sp. TCL26-01]|uniref:tetratricopeptide repeat protein n=1 Tax=Nostoc sp. TCL26-01 TaxID=2576904 RepID=UPI0015C1210D|nr:tetratricopeptide repeat protein [Nostoc sp. TCL26-01]QLE59980.1 tetratricopeptide repeat protein [Nostoc sp. TCL26-01]
MVLRKPCKKQARLLGHLGNVYYSLGNYQQSIEFFQQALEIDIPEWKAYFSERKDTAYKYLGTK